MHNLLYSTDLRPSTKTPLPVTIALQIGAIYGYTTGLFTAPVEHVTVSAVIRAVPRKESDMSTLRFFMIPIEQITTPSAIIIGPSFHALI